MTTPANQDTMARLTAAIAAHALWLESDGKQGARLRLADHPVAGSTKPRLANVRLDHADMTDADVSGWSFDRCRLDGARVDGLKADGATFFHTGMNRIAGRRASFDGAVLHQVGMSNAMIGELSIKGARLHKVSMSGVETRRLVADDARLDGAHGSLKVGEAGTMRNARIEMADLNLEANGLDMSGTAVSRSRLTARLGAGAIRGGRFEDTELLGSEWRGIAAQGLSIETSKLDAVRIEDSDLSAARISGSRLDAATLKRNVLRDVVVRDTSGDGLTLDHNDLTGAVLTELSGRLVSFRGNVTTTATRLSASMKRLREVASAAKRLVEDRQRANPVIRTKDTTPPQDVLVPAGARAMPVEIADRTAPRPEGSQPERKDALGAGKPRRRRGRPRA